MKRGSFKVVCGTLAFAMLLSVGTGCSTGNKNAEAKSSGTPDATKKGLPVELTVEVFDRAMPGLNASDNYLTKWIQEKFGAPNNITVKFIPIPRAQEVDKLNVLMASGEAPDICFQYSSDNVYTFGKNGGIQDLGNELKNAPTLTKFLGQEVLDYGKWDGIQYAIPAKRAVRSTTVSYIRKDWLDKLGLPLPKTTDEWYATMKAFKEKDPGKVGADKVIPFAIPMNLPFTAQNLIESFITKTSEEDFYAQANSMSPFLLPGYKEGIRFMNKLYNEGLVSPQFALDPTEAQYNKDLSQGRAGFMIHNYETPLRSVPGIMAELKKNVPDALFVPVDPFTNYEGKHIKPLNDPNGMFIFVPKSSKRLAEAIKYLDWMAQSDNLVFLQNGEKGIHYTDLKDGIPINSISNDKLSDDKKIFGSDIAIICNGKVYSSEEKTVEANSYSYPGYEDLYKQAYKISMTDTYSYPRFNIPIESSGKYASTLNSKRDELITKSFTCKPSDFDKTYDSLLKEYLQAGGQAVIDEKRAAYKKMKK